MLTIGLVQAPAAAQRDPLRTSITKLEKITTGQGRQAFSGKFASVDLKKKLLRVSTVEGGGTEIFQVTKGIPVETANGDKLKITEVKPGTHVIVYFEDRDGRRTAKEIMVLAVTPSKEKKKTPHPS